MIPGMRYPDEMSFSGNDVADKWKRWERTVKLFLVAVMAENSEKEQCAMFLYLIGEEGREIHDTLPVRKCETSY